MATPWFHQFPLAILKSTNQRVRIKVEFNSTVVISGITRRLTRCGGALSKWVLPKSMYRKERMTYIYILLFFKWSWPCAWRSHQWPVQRKSSHPQCCICHQLAFFLGTNKFTARLFFIIQNFLSNSFHKIIYHIWVHQKLNVWDDEATLINAHHTMRKFVTTHTSSSTSQKQNT